MKKEVNHSPVPDFSQTTDANILNLFTAGKGYVAMPIFQRKYREQFKSVRAYLLCRGCDAFGVDDVMQDAWVQFLVRIQAGQFEYRGEGSIFTWFFGIARNTFLKGCRHRSRYTAHFTDFDPTAFQAAALADNAQDEAAFAETVVETLAACLQRQSEKNRRLLLGYVVEGKNYEVLAAELGYFKKVGMRIPSPSTAKQRCYMVKMRLRAEMNRRMHT
ncbi:MAG: sigma-70 family RNA polymerase sigma factor [Saprospiraceae bacterium]|nr:sigma-70 family RNA polymerase sigma factor [Saprospiraceae bacterium]